MKKRDDLFVVDIFNDVASQVATDLVININYVYGTSIDILRNLKDKDESVNLGDTKYVLVALYMPFIEHRGNSNYVDVDIKRITIATLTNKDDEPLQRYQNTFKPILFPVYKKFLEKLARHKAVSCKDPDAILHDKIDVMGSVQVSGINDYIDSINIDNLKISFNPKNYC